MDRTGKIILVASVLLLIGAPVLQTMFGPKPQPAPEPGSEQNATSVTKMPPIIGPVPEENGTATPETATNNLTASTNAAPVTPSSPAAPEPVVKETTATLENEFVKFTFTTRGGGVKKVELKQFPKEIGGEVANTGPVEMNLDRGRLPLMAFEPRTASTVDTNPTADRPYPAAGSVYDLTHTHSNVVMTATFGDWNVRKVFTMEADYQLQTQVTVSNSSTNSLSEADFYLLTGTAIEPLNTSQMMGLNFGTMWFDGDEETKVDQGWFDNKPLGCMCMPGGDPRNNFVAGQGNVEWLGAYSRFFLQAVIPAEPGSAVSVHEFRLNPLSDTEAVAAGTKVKNNQMAWETAMAIKVPSLAPGTEKTFSYTLYTGPREYDRLKAIGAENGGNQFHLLMDFGKWFGWVAEGLLRLMKWMEPHLGFLKSLKVSSWALSIIVITLVIKLIFWPITAKSTRAMKKMAQVNAKMMPEITKIREKYKNDYQKMNMKMMETYQKYGVNPLSQIGGCLPMVIQIPVFFGFFTMLRSAVELRGSEFLWAADLSAPDTIAEIAGFPINILPLLMTGTMFLQMKLQPAAPNMDPTQQAIMKYMPLMFVFFFYSASSGLCLYWTVQNVLSIIQTKMTKVDPDEDNKVEVIPPGKKRKAT